MENPRRLLLAAFAAFATPALAGETACWFEHGLLVAPAAVAGLAGDYIVDTATPTTQLHDTAAQAQGLSETHLHSQVRLAGVTLAARPIEVADLDARGWMLPVPLAGVIGADVLRGFVVDVQFVPCRLRLSAPGQAPRFRRARTLPIRWIEGRPAVRAQVADDRHAARGEFVVSTGADAPIRLSDAAASAPGVAMPQELYPNGTVRPRLRELTLAGAAFDELAAGLEFDRGSAGVVGAEVLAHWRVRFDFPRGRLLLAPAQTKGPRRKPEPPREITQKPGDP